MARVSTSADPSTDKVSVNSIRAEAASMLSRFGRLPELMELDDLVHAGWLGYAAAYPRAKANPHAYAMQRARGAMLDELYHWRGFSGRAARKPVFYLDIMGCERTAQHSRPSAKVMTELGFVETVEPSDSFGRLSAVISGLPDQERQLIEHHYQDGQPLSVIAEERGVNPVSVYNLKYRTIQRLRRQLGVAA